MSNSQIKITDVKVLEKTIIDLEKIMTTLEETIKNEILKKIIKKEVSDDLEKTIGTVAIIMNEIYRID